MNHENYLNKIKDDILCYIFAEYDDYKCPSFKEFRDRKTISEDWKLSEDYEGCSYDAIAQIVDERTYEFFSHLDACGISKDEFFELVKNKNNPKWYKYNIDFKEGYMLNRVLYAVHSYAKENNCSSSKAVQSLVCVGTSNAKNFYRADVVQKAKTLIDYAIKERIIQRRSTKTRNEVLFIGNSKNTNKITSELIRKLNLVKYELVH